MSQFRHIISFLTVVAIYTILAIFYIQFLSKIKPPEPKRINRIKIAIIKPQVTPKPTVKPTVKPISTPQHILPPPIVKPQPKRVIKRKPKKSKRVVRKRAKIKPKPKRVVRKRAKIKPKPKRVVRKRAKIKPKPKRVVRKRAKIKPKPQRVKRRVAKRRRPSPKPTPIEYVEEYITEPIITYTPPPPPPPKRVIRRRVVTPQPQILRATPPPPPTPHTPNLALQKRRFLKQVRANIYANKHYPIKAKRRRIEGRVHLLFDINSNGEATNIRITNAHKLLRKAVKESLKQSFPIDIPSSLRAKFPMRNISINIDFRLE